MLEEAEVTEANEGPSQPPAPRPVLSTDDLVMMIGEREVRLREREVIMAMQARQGADTPALRSRMLSLEQELQGARERILAVEAERDKLLAGGAEESKLRAEVNEYQAQIKALFGQIEDLKRVNAGLEKGAAKAMRLEAENADLTKSVDSLRHYAASLEQQVHDVALERDELLASTSGKKSPKDRSAKD